MSVSQINRSTYFCDIPNGTTTPYPVPKRTICHVQKDGSCRTQSEAVYAKAKSAVQGGMVSAKKVGAASTVVNLMEGKNLFDNSVSLDILRASGSFFVAKTARNLVNAATEDPVIRTAGGAMANALRKVYLGASPLNIALGAANGAGFTLVGEAQEKLNKDGHTWLGEAVGVAGTYAVEMAEAVVLCFADKKKPCAQYMKTAAVVATTLLAVA